MSRDSQLYSVCDHKIIKELVSINSDYKTIVIPRELASKTIVLWINGYQFDSEDPKNGWSLILNKDYVYSPRYQIVFNKKRKSVDDFYEITYTVFSKICPKCLGLKILYDESYSVLGQVNMVENEDKLLQEIRKGMTAYLGSNPFHVWYGTNIYKLVGSKIYNADLIKGKITEEITSFIEKFLDIQTQQSQFQTITDRETFYSLISVNVYQPDDNDPTYWKIEVTFSNRTGDDMLYEKNIYMPGTIQ